MKTVFFIMPFGKKTINLNKIDEKKEITIDFEKNYKELRALFDDEKYLVYRSDDIHRIDVYEKMYKAINSADIVIADITGLNANVMYELGARHAFKDKKTIMITYEEFIYPFDISVFQIIKYLDFKENFQEIINSDGIDSPIKKSISSSENENKMVFKDLEDKWEQFYEKYNSTSNCSSNFSKKLELAEEFKGSLLGKEEFDSIYSLCMYKNNPQDLETLKYAKEILSKHDPINNINTELLGLLCSIDRRIIEAGYTNDKQVETLINNSFMFYSKGSSEYSHSTIILSLISIMEIEEEKYFKYSLIKEMSKISLKSLSMTCDADTVWYKETEDLLFASSEGRETDRYNNPDRTHVSQTSKEAYERAIKLFKKYNS